MILKHYLHILLAGAFAVTASGCHSEHSHEHENEVACDEKHDEGDDEHKEDAHAHDADEIIFTHKQAEAGGVETEKIVARPFHGVIRVGGQIRSAQTDEITLVAPSNGIVTWAGKSLSEGMEVAAGSTIAYVSGRKLQDGDPTAKARNTYETARKNYLRAKELQKDGIVSAKEFEVIEMQYHEARIAYEGLSDKATEEGVKVTSPMHGFIKNTLVTSGSYVTTGQPVATVSKNKRLQLLAYVPESYFAEIHRIAGANFRTTYDDRLYKMEELNGRMLSAAKSSDVANGYLPVTFEFDNRGAVIPGSFAEVYLTTQETADAITVPASALTEEQGAYFVYVHLEGDEYKRREVKTGTDDGDRIQIVSGLEAGETVVVKGSYQIKLAANSSVIPEGHNHNH